MEKIILCLQHSEIKLQDASACRLDGCCDDICKDSRERLNVSLCVYVCVWGGGGVNGVFPRNEVNVKSRLICYVDIQIQKRKMIKIQIKTVDALFCE
jgi:hypothetical protein